MQLTAWDFGKYARVSHPYAIPAAFPPEGMEEQLDYMQKSENMNIHAMLLCRIIIGRQQKGFNGQTAPGDGYDSTTGNNDLYYILFNSKRILPLAVIEYSFKVKGKDEFGKNWDK